MATTGDAAAKDAAWSALRDEYDAVAPQHLRDLFAQDPARGERLSAEAAGLYLDYSKNRVTAETVANCSCGWRRPAACAAGSTRCSAATRST